MTPKKNNNDFDAEIENDDLKQVKAETEAQEPAEEEVIVRPKSSYKNNASTMDLIGTAYQTKAQAIQPKNANNLNQNMTRHYRQLLKIK